MVLMGQVSINGALLPRLITGYPGHQKPWWNVRSLYVEVPCFCFFLGGSLYVVMLGGQDLV